MKLFMLGAGGHARVLQEILEQAGHELTGFIAPGAAESSLLGELTRYSDEEAIKHLSRENSLLINGVGSVRMPEFRWKIFQSYAAEGFNFLQLQAQTSHVSNSATLMAGVQVMHMAVIHSDAHIEDNVIVNTGAIVEHGCKIGNSTHIAVGAVLCGNVTVGEASHIGANATVLQGVTIGDYVTVGAGAVVTKDVPSFSKAVGVPAVISNWGSE
ncbi:MAG: hypothetical protein RL101_954 [Actinomycetota bacterium]|jgi:sugar O-acyltransferase (sialic acid O-acetyltransferase NeuD family)